MCHPRNRHASLKRLKQSYRTLYFKLNAAKESWTMASCETLITLTLRDKKWDAIKNYYDDFCSTIK